MKTKRTLHIGFTGLYILSDWGGAERVAVQLSAAMLARGHSVTIITREPQRAVSSKVPIYTPPEGCRLLKLELNTPEGLERARADIAQAGFDAVVAFFAGRDILWFPWLMAGSGIPLVAAVLNYPADIDGAWNTYEHFSALAACDRIQVLLEPYKGFYPPALQSRISAIGNPSPPAAEAVHRDEATPRRLLGAGWFNEGVKRFSLLLRAWAILAPDFPDWALTLVGDGPDYELYRVMAEALHITDSVTFTGSVTDMDAYYDESELFCMPSRQEGLPLVLLEAAARGLPLTAFHSCVAARTLIPEGGGALAPEDSPQSLAQTLRPIMAATPAHRRALGRAAQAHFQANYGYARVIDQWEALLLDAACLRGQTRLDTLLLNRWSAALLDEAALELVCRPSPMAPAGADGRFFGTAAARLASDYEALNREHQKLQRKYDALLREFQAAAGRAARKKPR